MSSASGNTICIFGLMMILALLAGKVSTDQGIQRTQNVATVQTPASGIQTADRRMSLEDFFLNRNSQQVGSPDQQGQYDQPIAAAQQTNPNSVVFVRDANIPNAAGNIVSRLILARRMLRLTRLMRRLRIVPRIFGLGMRRPLRQAAQAGGPLTLLTNRIGEAYNGEYDPRDFVFGNKGFNYNNTKDIFEKDQSNSQSYSKENNPNYQNGGGTTSYKSQPQIAYSNQPHLPLGYLPSGIKSESENLGKVSSDVNINEQNNFRNLQQYHQLLKNLQQLQELQKSFYSPNQNVKSNTQLEKNPLEVSSLHQNPRQPQYQSSQESLGDFYLDKPLSADELQQLQFLNEMLSRMTREQQIQLIHQIQQYRDQQIQELQEQKIKQQIQQLQDQQHQEDLKLKSAQQHSIPGFQQTNVGNSYEQPQLQSIQQIIGFNQQNNKPLQSQVSLPNHQQKLQDIQTTNQGYSNNYTPLGSKSLFDSQPQSLNSEEKQIPILNHQQASIPQLQHAHQGISNEHLQNSIKSLIDFHQQVHAPQQNQFTLSNQDKNAFQGLQHSNQQTSYNQQHQGLEQPQQHTLSNQQHENFQRLQNSILQLLSNQQLHGIQGQQQSNEDRLYKELSDYNQQLQNSHKPNHEKEFSIENVGNLGNEPQGKDLGSTSFVANQGTSLSTGGNVIGVGVNVGIKPAVDVAITKPTAQSIQPFPQLHNPIAVKPIAAPPVVEPLVPVGFLPKPILNLNGRLFLGAEVGKDVKVNAGVGR